jgi:magnesium-protoporphyrin O-methyltransferase
MSAVTYGTRRAELETYFDRTAAQAWEKLTSDAPVGRIRATVRAGRDSMRATLLGWLPQDLSGRRVLDAGCGTGAFSVEAARRGAEVVAVDLSGTLLATARDRLPADIASRITFRVGDMREAASFGRFDHVVAMDSLIHYPSREIAAVLAAFADCTTRSIVYTIAPRTPSLSMLHAVGRLFPRGDRAPAIEPVSSATISSRLAEQPSLSGWGECRSFRVNTGFYKSQAQELVRA